jgi:hypothetical protein
MTFRVILIWLFSALLIPPALSGQSQFEVAKMPAAFLVEAQKLCQENGTTFSAKTVLAEETDIDGDGISDLIIDWGGIDCTDESKYNCGSGGCMLDFYLSRSGGYLKAGDMQSHEYRLIKGKSFRMIAKVHHIRCGSRPGHCVAELSYVRGKLIEKYRAARASEK